jgi:uncharacterized LabA/DUF88 family protein
MAKIFFFVDGFNLYHALNYLDSPGVRDHDRYQKYKWISLKRLCNCYVREKGDSIGDILYFTALAFWDPEKVSRHKLFIKAQESEGVHIVYGEFKRRLRKCKICSNEYPAFEEKQTDVNIAVQLFQLASEERYDKAIIISGDSDLLPAIKAVRRIFPRKQVGIVVPIGRGSSALKTQADFSYKMKEGHLKISRYDKDVVLKDGTILSCPSEWR